MYTAKRFNNSNKVIEEKRFSFISDAIEYYLNNYDVVKIYDAHGTEIPKSMLF